MGTISWSVLCRFKVFPVLMMIGQYTAYYYVYINFIITSFLTWFFKKSPCFSPPLGWFACGGVVLASRSPNTGRSQGCSSLFSWHFSSHVPLAARQDFAISHTQFHRGATSLTDGLSYARHWGGCRTIWNQPWAAPAAPHRHSLQALLCLGTDTQTPGWRWGCADRDYPQGIVLPRREQWHTLVSVLKCRHLNRGNCWWRTQG